MDFGTLLHVAKKNSESGKNEGKYYSTKFAPPKKESKEKKLSDNIQKFLQKREQEEKARQAEERQKVANLLAQRDEKSKNKIRKMLKVTKSANKSVLDDAINTEHTAISMQGPDQPDQDDYGYVSTEANAFYQKYIEKVKDVKEDKGFQPSRPQSLKDLTGTKERVKAAITKEIEEKKSHTRQRISHATPVAKDPSVARSYSTNSSKNLYDPEAERREEERKKREEEQKRAKSRKPLPPPMDFQALLKLAEKKQHEPVDLLPEIKKKKEPERLLTSKERREQEERQREQEARERRKRERNGEAPERSKERSKEAPSSSSGTGGGGRMEPNGRIPKLSQAGKPAAPSTTSSSSSMSSSSSSSAKSKPAASSAGSNGFKKPQAPAAAPPVYKATPIAANSNAKSLPNKSSASASKTSSSSSSYSSTASTASSKSSSAASKSSSASSSSALSSSKSAPIKNPYASASSSSTREFPPRDLKNIKPRQFPPPDVQKTRQFPPPDVRRGGGNRPGDNRKQQAAPKRRILDDDDDSEYDSELDDFIDDGDCGEDYSSHIKAIFGYDKAKYRDLDDDDDAGMESNFAQQQREEYLSKKIGIQEDLEDMKLEAMEKKRKTMIKKRKL